MKKTKTIILMTLFGAVILQAAAFCNASSVYYENGFAIGISNSSKSYDVALNLIYVLFPLAFILFFFSGTVQEMTQGYGRLMIIRNYSKTKLIVKKICMNMVLLLIVILFQCIVFFFFNSLLNKVENGMPQSIVMYFIILHAIIMLQYFLEFYMPAQNVHLILLIYSFISYYIIQITEENFLRKVFLFPCLMFGMQNGSIDSQNIYYLYLGTGIFINLLLLVLCVRKFKKTDIF